MKENEWQSSSMTLLPCDPELPCTECADKSHTDPTEPHNNQSLYYQYKIYAANGRWPTWVDAMAHCDEATKHFWSLKLRLLKAVEPPLSKAELKELTLLDGKLHEPGGKYAAKAE